MHCGEEVYDKKRLCFEQHSHYQNNAQRARSGAHTFNPNTQHLEGRARMISEASLVYIVSSRPARATWRDPVSNITKHDLLESVFFFLIGCFSENEKSKNGCNSDIHDHTTRI